MHLNAWAITAAFLSRIVIGAFWYSPVLFQRRWLTLTQLSPEAIRASSSVANSVDLFGTYVLAVLLAIAVDATGATGVAGGAVLGFAAWIGCVAPITLSTTLRERRPVALWGLNNAYQLLTLVIMAVIVTVWRRA